MDELSLRFAEEKALREVDECTDIEGLRRLTRTLVKGHFQSRAFIATLLRKELDAAREALLGP